MTRPRRRPGHRPSRTFAAAAVLAVLLGACGGIPSSEAPLDEATYVAVTARLSLLTERARDREPPPESLVAHARAEILAGAGVTSDQLLEFARRVGDEPGRMRDLWSAVKSAADSLEEAGWTPPGFPAPADSATADPAAAAATDSAAAAATDSVATDSAAGALRP